MQMKKKNSQLHIYLESDLKEILEKQAREERISICEFCRRKLKEDSKLDKIEKILEELLKK